MSKLSFLKFNGSFSGNSTSLRKNTAQKNSFKSSQTSNVETSFQPKIDEMKWVFEKFDTNKDGKISLEEHKSAARPWIKVLVILMSDATKAFKAMDSDKDGIIEFKEFMKMFNGEGNKIKEEDIKSAFQVFDINGDGKISAEELSQIFIRLGESCSCSLNACKKMVKGVDGDGDGLIDLNEFTRMMMMMMSGKKLLA